MAEYLFIRLFIDSWLAQYYYNCLKQFGPDQLWDAYDARTCGAILLLEDFGFIKTIRSDSHKGHYLVRIVKNWLRSIKFRKIIHYKLSNIKYEIERIRSIMKPDRYSVTIYA